MKIRNQSFVILGLRILVIWGMLFFTHSMALNWVFVQDQTTREILDHLTKLGKATDSYQADVTSIIEGHSGRTHSTSGKFKYKWPRMLWTKVWRIEDGKLIGLTVSNGKIRWVYSPITNMARKYIKQTMHEDAQEKGWFSADVLNEASLVYLGKNQLEGEEVYIIEGEPSDLIKQKNPNPPGKTRFYIGAKDGIMRKIITYNPDGREIGSQTFKNIQRDLSISNQDFDFTPPEGAQILEVKDVGPRTNPEK